MNEAAAREATLLQAFEAAQPPSPNWSEDDRAWADRVAVEAAGAQAEPAAFVAQRARHAMQRLAPREKVAARWLGEPLWRTQWTIVFVTIAFVAGLFADSIGPGQRINLLAPPMWGVLIWNATVYAGLLATLLAAAMRRGPRPPGPIVRGMQGLLRVARRAPKAGPLRQFAQLWATRSARLTVLRAETVLHASAAALGLGLIAGLYARGLVLDYRAAWESTLLSPEIAHALVTGLLSPASALTGIALPDVAGFATMQAAHGDATGGAPAAPWIHLFATTLSLFVVVPRSVLALSTVLRAKARERRFPMPLDDAYFQRLLRSRRGGVAQIDAWPYGGTPTPQAVLGLQRVVAQALGNRAGLRIAPTVEVGHDLTASLAAETSHAIAWFDLSATPEPETHATFVRQLTAAAAAGVPVVVLIDESSFRRRFEAMPERLAQRRDLWGRLCDEFATLPVFVDLEAPDAAAAAAAFDAALARPVHLSASADAAMPSP